MIIGRWLWSNDAEGPGEREMGETETFLKKQSEQWGILAQQCKFVRSSRPIADERAVSTAVFFRITHFDDVPIPSLLLEKSKKSQESVQLHLSATLFDTKAKGESAGAFLGNTWIGKRKNLSECDVEFAAVKESKGNARDTQLRKLNFGIDSGFVFRTSLNLDDLKVIVECVVTIFEKGTNGSLDPASTETYGIFWCALPIKPVSDLPLEDTSDAAAALLKNCSVTESVYSGTPRLLFFANTEAQLKKAAKLGAASTKFICMKYEKLTKVFHLMAENDLCGGGDNISGAVPGLVNIQASKSTGHGRSEGFVTHDSADVETLEEFEFFLDENRFQVSYDLEKSILSYFAGQTPDITKEPSTKSIAMFMDIGVHNGRRFVGDGPGTSNVEGIKSTEGIQSVKLEKNEDGVWTTGCIKLKRCMASNMITIVVVLKASIRLERKESILCLGWIPILPWRDKDILVGKLRANIRTSPPFSSVTKVLCYQDIGCTPPIFSTVLQYSGPREKADIERFIAKPLQASSTFHDASITGTQVASVQDLPKAKTDFERQPEEHGETGKTVQAASAVPHAPISDVEKSLPVAPCAPITNVAPSHPSTDPCTDHTRESHYQGDRDISTSDGEAEEILPECDSPIWTHRRSGRLENHVHVSDGPSGVQSAVPVPEIQNDIATATDRSQNIVTMANSSLQEVIPEQQKPAKKNLTHLRMLCHVEEETVIVEKIPTESKWHEVGFLALTL